MIKRIFRIIKSNIKEFIVRYDKYKSDVIREQFRNGHF